eukprot:760727-Hanusia_phi.AAC.5
MDELRQSRRRRGAKVGGGEGAGRGGGLPSLVRADFQPLCRSFACLIFSAQRNLVRLTDHHPSSMTRMRVLCSISKMEASPHGA